VTRVLLLRNVPEEGNLSLARYADEVARGLAARPGFEVRALTVHMPRAGSRAGSYLARYGRYPLLARRAHTQADVFHVPDHSYAHLVPLLPPGRTVVTCHDLVLLRMARGEGGLGAPRATVELFRRIVAQLRHAAWVVTPSEATRRDAIELVGLPPERVSVVPNGVGPEFRPLAPAERERVRADLTAEPDERLVLHVSTGDPYKNVPAVLDVVAELRSRGLPVRLVRTGRKLSAEDAQRADRLGIRQWISDLGRVPERRLVETYGAADLLLFPSIWEGFGLPPLEAMACGTPVVTSRAPALLEVVGEAGLSAEAADVAGLADAAERVLSDADFAARLRETGLARAGGFGWGRTVDLLVDVYGKLPA
jgi:glycosyltransferase involved in cell wall biosynthesis